MAIRSEAGVNFEVGMLLAQPQDRRKPGGIQHTISLAKRDSTGHTEEQVVTACKQGHGVQISLSNRKIKLVLKGTSGMKKKADKDFQCLT